MFEVQVNDTLDLADSCNYSLVWRPWPSALAAREDFALRDLPRDGSGSIAAGFDKSPWQLHRYADDDVDIGAFITFVD